MPDSTEAASPASSAYLKPLVSEDAVSRALLAQLDRVAPSDAPVLITGETGTGKELIARELHARSRRAERPFVAVNAGGFSESLIESELFGHEKGAFTGAHASKPGWFEAAHGGSLFLDEIGDLPLSLQVKLLRVLQEGEVVRLGSRQPLRVDVRLIAATNVDLLAAIRARTFREDLFYRLRVASLRVPALRERRGDILPLARHFLALYSRRLGIDSVAFGASALHAIAQHSWPGNVRELENAVHQALLVRQGPELSAHDLQLGPSVPESILAVDGGGTLPEQSPELGDLERALLALLDQKLPDLHGQVESTLLKATYRYSGGNQLETARLLGMSRNVVRARLIEHGEIRGPLRSPARILAADGGWCEGVLRIGYQKLGLLMLVKGYGAFEAVLAARGVRIEWLEYASGMQIVAALRRGELAAGIVGDSPAVYAQAEEVPVVYVAAEPPAPRGTALIVPDRSRLGSVAELRGKRIVVNQAAQAHYLLVRALEEAGVERSEVEIQFATPERALRAFERGEADAWSIWDPWLSSARIDLGARVLRDATGLMNNSAYYLARRDFAEQRPDLVSELLLHIQLTAQWIQSDPERAAHLIAPGLGFSARALTASLQRELHTVPVSAEMIAAQQDVADTLLRMQLIPHAVSVADARWRLGTG